MGFIVKGVKSVVKAVGSVIKGAVGIVSKVVGGVFGFLIGGKKGKEAETPNTLNKQLDPDASRKIIFGKIAAPLDTRYWEVWGTKGEKFDEVVAHATHRVNAILELYVEDKLAIDSAGNVQAAFAGVLSRNGQLGTVGQVGIAVGGGTQWNANATFDGCAYSIYKWVPDDKKLPNGIPDRYTQVVEGALVYDPRRDSTVPGGSGTHRANDRSTWSYATLDGNGKPIGRNNALQALWYLLGWTIPTKDAGGVVTGEMLVAGRGVAVEDINMASFIAGANACEAAGYYTDLVLSTADDHTSNENAITCDGLIGRLIDPGGLWSYYANVDDTANIAVDLTDADILDGVSVNWDEYKGMSEQYNQVGGKFVNPSSTVLYQAFPYPLVRDATYEGNLGKKVRKTQDFRQVLDGVLAQRLARLLLNEGQYQGEFSAGFNYRALKAQAYSVVRYTSERFGWTKLFRVWRFDISTEGGVGMLLKEIHPSIWQAGTVAAAQPTAAGLKYDPRTEYTVGNFNGVQLSRAGPDNTRYDDISLTWDAAPNNVRRTEIRYKLNGTAYWTSGGTFERDVNTTVLTGLLSGAYYDIQARHISVHEIPGPWANAGPFLNGSTGNVNLAAIQAAGGTANWSQVVDNDGNKPADNADVTAANQAATIANQSNWATTNQAYNDASIKLSGVDANATNDRITDNRNTNQPPSWYRSNYALRTIGEFKDGSVLGVPGFAANVYGYLETSTDYSDTSGGTVKQTFEGGSGALAGVKYRRYSAVGSDATWQAWNREYNELQKPYFGNDLLEASNGAVATLGNFKTIQGQAASISNQGYFATQNYADFDSRVTGVPSMISDFRTINGVRRFKADYISNNNGSDLQYFWPEDVNSNRTETRQAATISNQGALATKSAVSWSLEVTGRPPIASAQAVTADERLVDRLAWNGVPEANHVLDGTGDGYFSSTAAAPLAPYGSFERATPIDYNGTYEAYFDVLEEGGGTPTGRFYTIINLFNGSGGIITGAGSFWLYPVSYEFLQQRGSYRRYVARFGKGTGNPFPHGALRFSLGVLLNYGNTGNPMRVRRMWARKIDREPFVGTNPTFFAQADNAIFRTEGIDGWGGANRLWAKSFTRGPQVLSGEPTPNPESGAPYSMMGLSAGNSPGYQEFDAAFFVYSTTQLQVYSLGGNYGTHAYAPGDVLRLVYDGLWLRWFRNKDELYSKFVGANKSYKAAFDVNGINTGWHNLAWASQENFGVIGTNLATAGGVVVPQSGLVTAEGQAATIANQGAFATISSAPYGSSLLTGFGEVAQFNNLFFGQPGGADPRRGRVIDENNAFYITNAIAVTSQGQAATIANQGWGATATEAAAANNRVVNGQMLILPLPEGGAFNGGANHTGRINIYLPEAAKNSYAMLSFDVVIYNYDTNTSCKYHISGYIYNGRTSNGQYDGEKQWYNLTASYTGHENRSFRVGFGYTNSGRPCVQIGFDGTVWTYPKVTVENVRVPYAGIGAAQWASGWYMAIGPGELEIGAAANGWFINKPRPGDAVFGEGVKEEAGGAIATLPNFKTNQGQAASIANQAAWATSAIPTSRLNRINDAGRVYDPTIYNTSLLLSAKSTSNLTPSYDTSNASYVTVSIPSHTRTIAGPSGPLDLTYGAGSLTVPYNTYFYCYVDDANLGGIGSPSYSYTTDAKQLLHPSRYLIATGSTPAASGGTVEPGTYDCVAMESFMPDGRQAYQYEAGDFVEALDYDTMNSLKLQPVTSNKIAVSPCVRITSESGISVICAETTPCTLLSGMIVSVFEVIGEFMPVKDADGFRWERMAKVENVGNREVAHIYCDGHTYGAGEVEGRFVYTHNPSPTYEIKR